jgi:hypothetical protein
LRDGAIEDVFTRIAPGAIGRALHVTVPPNYPKDGGYLRSQQIADGLRSSGLGYVYCPLHDLKIAARRDVTGALAYFFQALPAALLQWDTPSLRSTCKAFLALRAAKPVPGDIVVIDIPGEYASAWLVRWARCRGARVVVAPHNIEALLKAGPFAARIEAAAWSEADAAVFITHADRDYAIDRGCRNTELLEYRPPALQRAFLAEIAQQRGGRRRRHVLILGSASNPPTRAGMERQLSKIEKMAQPELPFIFAGKHTERLCSSGGSVELRGRVSDAELRELYLDAAVLWVVQPAATGVLTRIADAIEAGIPVLANRFAARGYEGSSGVRVYDDGAFSEALLSEARAESPPQTAQTVTA